MSRKIKEQYTGGDYDAEIQPSAIEHINKVSDDPEFFESIRELLARYRDYRKFVDTNPSNSEVREHLDKVIKGMEKLKENLDLLPSSFKSHFADIMYFRTGSHETAYLKLSEFKSMLQIYPVYIKAIKNEQYQHKSKSGHSSLLEKKLLSDVSLLIEQSDNNFGLYDSAELAREILVNCKVPYLPGTTEKAREAIREIRDSPHI